jgi:hypothetical protein
MTLCEVMPLAAESCRVEGCHTQCVALDAPAQHKACDTNYEVSETGKFHGFALFKRSSCWAQHLTRHMRSFDRFNMVNIALLLTSRVDSAMPSYLGLL